jgi:hypothetical protein
VLIKDSTLLLMFGLGHFSVSSRNNTLCIKIIMVLWQRCEITRSDLGQRDGFRYAIHHVRITPIVQPVTAAAVQPVTAATL